MNKTVKRLLLFYAMSFLPLFLGIQLVSRFVTPNLFVSDREEWIYMVGFVGMLLPSLAHLLTRVLTKEGFANTYLMPNFEQHKKEYLSAGLVILGMQGAELLIFWRVYLPQFSLSELFENPQGIALLLYALAYSVIMVFPAFGEEWGWRAYMMPKLKELFGQPLAILIGGVLWGLWHAPLTVTGHNFGVDYPGFPYVGILLMCIFCTALNAFFTLLTERTKSVYPAAIAHMLNNNLGFTIGLSALADPKVLEYLEANQPDSIQLMLVVIPVALLVGAVSVLLLCKGKKQEVKIPE